MRALEMCLFICLPFTCFAQALVQKGEKHHMFSDSIPANIQRSVNEENLQFMQHRDIYCPEYFEFIYRLTLANSVSLKGDHCGPCGVTVM